MSTQNIIGETFGLWTVENSAPNSKSGHRQVIARCACGKTQVIAITKLVRGNTTGCLSCKARQRGPKIKVGDTFKKWTVTGGPIISKHGNKQWEVTCECGTTRWMQGNALVRPNTSFQCVKCAGLERGYKDTIRNGRIGDLTQTRYSKLRKNANARNIVFDVSKEYLWNLFITQSSKCAITNDVLESIDKASLDRIDSTKGYIEGNIQWVSIQANLSKHVMSMEELYDFCRKVLNHANQQPS